ncbi:hypothetical protein LKO27_14470 [Tessaracoccus sp. OS52]|uniref:hypothetical protein n=1 Tax=Tessaracoccus sp. OS52 TaxID=2886691 RepID=UPI001D10B975|nr:hypothetical protein [Tessaracoccus sp. OS52]MCC2594607.1 hypothetical protein [Tessaracoccus sp. OS52]
MSDDRGLRLRDKSPDYYRWMYLKNPAGRAVVQSARLGDRVIASFAVAPKIFQVGGERVTIGKTMDMFTDPAFQGKGLIKRCTCAAFEGALAAGMSGWYVTPSVNSYPIFTVRWGYREDLRVVYRARVLRFAPVLAAMIRPTGPARVLGELVDAVRRLLPRRPPRLPEGWHLEELQTFGKEADELWDSVSGGYPVAIVRNAEYLNWRYIANPGDYTILGLRQNGRLAGILVLAETLRRGVPVGEIVDFVCEADDEATFGTLISAAAEHSRARGHALVQAWSVFGTALDARMRRAGLRFNRTDVKFLTSPGLTDPLLADPDSWLLTQGDGNDV